jgi:hypothetical protein
MYVNFKELAKLDSADKTLVNTKVLLHFNITPDTADEMVPKMLTNRKIYFHNHRYDARPDNFSGFIQRIQPVFPRSILTDRSTDSVPYVVHFALIEEDQVAAQEETAGSTLLPDAAQQSARA